MAKAGKLTETRIAKAELRPDQKQEILWDSEVRGFGVRILPRSKVFWFQYRPGGGRRSSRMVRILSLIHI